MIISCLLLHAMGLEHVLNRVETRRGRLANCDCACEYSGRCRLLVVTAQVVSVCEYALAYAP